MPYWDFASMAALLFTAVATPIEARPLLSPLPPAPAPAPALAHIFTPALALSGTISSRTL